MTEAEEQAYMQGRKALLRQQFAQILSELDDEVSEHRWKTERLDIVAALRSVCREHGDNNWKDSDHLGDVISKHLADYLD